MDELHAAIAAHLRAQRQPVALARRPEDAILGLWRERAAVPRCRVCGAPVNDNEDGLYNLAAMQAVRSARAHYVPF